MYEILGWICTVLVLIGYFLNANKKLIQALIIWLIGDIGWIIYDIHINNFSHLTLCTIIIGINIFGLIKNGRKQNIV